MIAPSLSPKSLSSWPALAAIFPHLGPAGIHEADETTESHVLLYRTRRGRMIGFLELCNPSIRKGELIVQVAPRYRRRGIASALMAEAQRRWAVNLAPQRYTPDGAAWMNAYQERQTQS